jgi:hypothetical protein
MQRADRESSFGTTIGRIQEASAAQCCTERKLRVTEKDGPINRDTEFLLSAHKPPGSILES